MGQSRTLNSHSTHHHKLLYQYKDYTCSSKSIYNLIIGKEKYYDDKMTPTTPHPKPAILFLVLKSKYKPNTEVPKLVIYFYTTKHLLNLEHTLNRFLFLPGLHYIDISLNI